MDKKLQNVIYVKNQCIDIFHFIYAVKLIFVLCCHPKYINKRLKFQTKFKNNSPITFAMSIFQAPFIESLFHPGYDTTLANRARVQSREGKRQGIENLGGSRQRPQGRKFSSHGVDIFQQLRALLGTYYLSAGISEHIHTSTSDQISPWVSFS